MPLFLVKLEILEFMLFELHSSDSLQKLKFIYIIVHTRVLT